MKVLIVTDSPTLTSGSSRTCRELLACLKKKPVKSLAVAAWFHTSSEKDASLGYTIYPVKKVISMNNPEMVTTIDRYEPTVVIFHGDIFSFSWLKNVKKQCKTKFKAIGYLTIDGKLLDEWEYVLEAFDEIISPSKYGVKQIRRVGFKAEYVPHGVDKDTFKKLDSECVKIKENDTEIRDSFVCLIDKQNTSRSNIPDAFKAFKKFSKDKDDVYLLVNAQAVSIAGFNLKKFAESLGILDKMAFVSGCGPVNGLPDETINTLYNASSVLLWPSIGDGFGLGLLQAMRTRTIPIATNYSSMTELVKDRGILVDVDRYIIGEYDIERAFLDVDKMVEGIESIYQSWKGDKKLIDELVTAGLNFSEDMTWEKCGEGVWDSILRATETFTARIERKNALSYISPESKGLVSVITCVHNTDVGQLSKCIDSVLNQTYKNVELILVNDGSTNQETNDFLKSINDKNVTILNIKKGGIVRATNAGLRLISPESEYVAFLDHDDYLFSTAIAECVNAVGTSDTMTYCDEVLIDTAGEFMEMKMKQDVYPELLIQQNQVGHFNLLRRSVMDEVGEIKYEGAQDHYLALKMILGHSLTHIKKVLYAYRIHPNSINSTGRLVTSTENGEKMARDLSSGTTVTGGMYPGVYKVDREIKENPSVQILILSKDNPIYLRNCIEGVRRNTTYPNYSIAVVDTGSIKETTYEYYEQIKSKGIRVLYYPDKYNFSKANNWAIKELPIPNFYLFLNDDTIVSSGWMKEMLTTIMIPDAGMVGAKLIFPQDETIQHAGIYFAPDFNGHHYAIGIRRALVPINASIVRRMVSVTGACILVDATLFHLVGGFDEQLQCEWQEIALSMQLRKEGYETYYTPYAEAYHYQGVTRNKVNDGVHPADRQHIYKDYNLSKILTFDPEYQKKQREIFYGL